MATTTRTLIKLLALVALAGSLRAANVTFIQPAATISETLIKLETFEATGYDAGNTWTEVGTGTCDEDYNGANVLVGSQSLNIATSGTSISSYLSYTLAQDDQYFFFRVKKNSGTSNPLIFAVLSSTGTSLGTITHSAGGVLTATATGGTGDPTVATFGAGTEIFVWVHFTTGSGANATMRVWASTNGTKPSSSGDNYAESTNGTSTAQGGRARFGYTASATADYTFDSLKIDDVALGNQ